MSLNKETYITNKLFVYRYIAVFDKDWYSIKYNQQKKNCNLLKVYHDGWKFLLDYVVDF